MKNILLLVISIMLFGIGCKGNRKSQEGQSDNGFWSSQNYRNAHANGEGRITIFRQ